MLEANKKHFSNNIYLKNMNLPFKSNLEEQNRDSFSKTISLC